MPRIRDVCPERKELACLLLKRFASVYCCVDFGVAAFFVTLHPELLAIPGDAPISLPSIRDILNVINGRQSSKSRT